MNLPTKFPCGAPETPGNTQNYSAEIRTVANGSMKEGPSYYNKKVG